jgi:hypothetical protein
MNNKATKWVLGAAVLTSTGLLGQNAWSGKPERDKIDELTPKVADAKTNIKASCGCDVGIDVKFDTYKAADDMRNISRSLDAVTAASKNYCVKPSDKKAFCGNVSSVEVSWALSIDPPKMDGKKLVMHSNYLSYNSDTNLAVVFNKF